MAFRYGFRYIAVSAVLAVGLAGQSKTQSIESLVTDTTGAIVAGVNVTIVSLAVGVSSSVVTNSNNNYTFTLVPVGKYDVKNAPIPLGGPKNRAPFSTTSRPDNERISIQRGGQP